MDRPEPAPKQQKLCQPIPRWRHAATQVGSNLYIWGGFILSEFQKPADCMCLEVFDFQTCQWEQIATNGTPHPGFELSACTAIGDNLYMFGGRREGDQFNNALYQINLKTKEWKELSTPSPNSPSSLSSPISPSFLNGPSSPNNCPAKKIACGMVSHGEDLVVFAGYLEDGNYTNELHVYKTKNGEWHSPRVRGTPPSPRADFTWTKIDDNRALLIGGWDKKTRYDDTYILDMSDANEWEWKASAQQPLARSHHSASLIGRAEQPAVLVVGGLDADSRVLRDAWVWVDDPQGGNWVEVHHPGVPQRYEHTTAVYAIDSGVWLLAIYGGREPRHPPHLDIVTKHVHVLREIECDIGKDSCTQWRIPDSEVPLRIYPQKRIEYLQNEVHRLQDQIEQMHGNIAHLKETEQILRKRLQDARRKEASFTLLSDERPTLLQFQVLKGVKGEIRIMDTVAPHWRDFGIALGFDSSDLDALEEANFRVPKRCTERVFGLWSKRGLNFTWGGLVTALEDSGFKQLACDLKEALCHLKEDH